jgi:hypothetical protein
MYTGPLRWAGFFFGGAGSGPICCVTLPSDLLGVGGLRLRRPSVASSAAGDRSPDSRATGSWGAQARREEESMRCHRRRRATQHGYPNTCRPEGCRRHRAISVVAAPRRCSGIACVAPPCMWPDGACNAAVWTPVAGCRHLEAFLAQNQTAASAGLSVRYGWQQWGVWNVVDSGRRTG